MRKPSPSDPLSRRDVLRASGVAAAGWTLATGPFGLVVRRRGERLRVGLVGCGGRGTGAAANALHADPDVQLVAMGDTFADQLASSLATLKADPDVGARVDVPAERQFVGFEAYRGVIEASDVVLLATTPHFRPLHVRAAIDAGKHLFVEKPVATDAPGVRAVRDACRTAREKKLCVVGGLCYRYDKAKRETLRRIHEGAVGDVVALQCTYNTGALWHRGRRPEWSEMEFQIRNWLYFTWLSGDHIVEQHVHSLDKLAWVMRNEYPVKATASGGRTVRTDPKFGNVYDHFNTVYEWKSGVRGFSSCRQWNGAASDVSDYVFGTRGVANVQTHSIEGAQAWKWRSDTPDDMYQNEHDALFAAIRKGEPIDDSEILCNSTMMAILGRMAAYTGQTITWEQAWNSQESLAPASYTWGNAPKPIIAVPGETKFV